MTPHVGTEPTPKQCPWNQHTLAVNWSALFPRDGKRNSKWIMFLTQFRHSVRWENKNKCLCWRMAKSPSTSFIPSWAFLFKSTLSSLGSWLWHSAGPLFVKWKPSVCLGHGGPVIYSLCCHLKCSRCRDGSLLSIIIVNWKSNTDVLHTRPAIYNSRCSADVFLICHPSEVVGINPILFFWVFPSKITVSLENSSIRETEK